MIYLLDAKQRIIIIDHRFKKCQTYIKIHCFYQNSITKSSKDKEMQVQKKFFVTQCAFQNKKQINKFSWRHRIQFGTCMIKVVDIFQIDI